MEENNQKGRVFFEYNGKKYIYDYNILTLEQLELAKELTLFKYHQSKVNPDNFDMVIKSQGAYFTAIMLSFLLREYKDNKPLEFNYDKSEFETLIFVKNLPASELPKCEEVLTDFFTKSGLGKVGSALLSRNTKLGSMEIISQLMLKNMITQMNKKD